MTDAERDGIVQELVEVRRRPPNGELDHLAAEIREYERRYEVSTAQMMRELREGKRKETAEIASWLISVRLRDRIAARAARS